MAVFEIPLDIPDVIIVGLWTKYPVPRIGG